MSLRSKLEAIGRRLSLPPKSWAQPKDLCLRGRC